MGIERGPDGLLRKVDDAPKKEMPVTEEKSSIPDNKKINDLKKNIEAEQKSDKVEFRCYLLSKKIYSVFILRTEMEESNSNLMDAMAHKSVIRLGNVILNAGYIIHYEIIT